MLISKKPHGPNANPKIGVASLFCATLPASCPMRAPTLEYDFYFPIGMSLVRQVCQFVCLLLRGVANENPVSGGLVALVFTR